MKQLKITLNKSLISRKPNQVATAKALGLNKINQVIIKPNNPAVRGMVDTIAHLITVEEV